MRAPNTEPGFAVLASKIDDVIQVMIEPGLAVDRIVDALQCYVPMDYRYFGYSIGGADRLVLMFERGPEEPTGGTAPFRPPPPVPRRPPVG